MSKSLLIFSLIGLLYSCSKKELEPSTYDIRIENAYFETVTAVTLGDYTIGEIESGEISQRFSIDKGVYDFSCLTQSKLKITVEVYIQGSNDQITIKLNNKGKVELE